MKSAMLVEDFEVAFEPAPAKVRSSAAIAPAKSKPRPAAAKMTAADWNKFEKDIADAFEQVP